MVLLTSQIEKLLSMKNRLLDNKKKLNRISMNCFENHTLIYP